jgi:hypothetical protein
MQKSGAPDFDGPIALLDKCPISSLAGRKQSAASYPKLKFELRHHRLLARPRESRAAAELREGAVGRHESLKHRGDQFRRLDGPLPGLTGQYLAIGDVSRGH